MRFSISSINLEKSNLEYYQIRSSTYHRSNRRHDSWIDCIEIDGTKDTIRVRPEDKKFMWWGLLGIGVAAFFYFLSKNNPATQQQAVQVPYLVPTTMASPTASTSLSNQPNIIGTSSNSSVPNFTNPYAVSANAMEAPGTWGFMPNLMVNGTSGPINTLQFGSFNPGFNFTSPPSTSPPMNTLPIPQTGNPMVVN